MHRHSSAPELHIHRRREPVLIMSHVTHTYVMSHVTHMDESSQNEVSTPLHIHRRKEPVLTMGHVTHTKEHTLIHIENLFSP